MSGDIEDFLRRAAERRKQQQQQARRPGAPTPQVPRPTAPDRRPPRRDVVVEAEIVAAEPVTGDDVAADVARHLDTRKFTERLSHLGEGVRQEEERLRDHVQADIGSGPTRLVEKTVAGQAPVEKTTDVAAIVTAQPISLLGTDVIAMLFNPQALRQVVILNEIFQRPEHQW